uniref:Uncharacterized protein n=1 Tax=Nelumbo nucifera TaxID=4432 RepID=A0A822XZ28_NELNU|nr:TPA_asm: hypothetical protein HUJ06_024111 [Nelumbo nucifera]
MEWRLLQTRVDIWWKELYKQQVVELRKVENNLKFKKVADSCVGSSGKVYQSPRILLLCRLLLENLN